MRQLGSLSAHHSGQVGLAPDVEELLVKVVADGFTAYRCGPKHAPYALLACYPWEHYVDLLTITDFDRMITARVPKHDTLDIFAPTVVVWSYQGPPRPALRALLELVHPAHPDAPHIECPATADLHIPRARQRPMTIRLPAPGRVRVRAERLATAMSSRGDRAGQRRRASPGA